MNVHRAIRRGIYRGDGPQGLAQEKNGLSFEGEENGYKGASSPENDPPLVC